MFASPDQVEDLTKGDVYVQEPQTTESAAEVRVVPEVLYGYLVSGKEAGEVVETPGVHPGDHDKEGADFDGEDGKEQGPQAAA